MSVVSLSGYRSLDKWIDSFLSAEENKVSPVVWINYSRSLELWRLFLGCYYGPLDLRQLKWEHFEGFVAYWYFRYAAERSLEEAEVLLLTLENFHCWLMLEGIIQKMIWQESEGQQLKRDLSHALTFQNMRKPLEKKSRLACSAGWYAVEGIDDLYAEISSIPKGTVFRPLLSSGMKKFLQVGDIYMGSVWQGRDKKTFVDEYSIRTLYPKAAKRYFTLYG